MDKALTPSHPDASSDAAGDAPASSPERVRRPIRSFVLREGRLTTGQERAFRELWPRFGVDWLPGEALDPRALFAPGQPSPEPGAAPGVESELRPEAQPEVRPSTLHGAGPNPQPSNANPCAEASEHAAPKTDPPTARPITLEIGFGDGESLVAMAAAAPERDFIGLEVHRPGVGHLLLELERQGLTNVRVLRTDATALLETGLAPASLDAVQLFFPDPWPKKRHHKRRIVQPGLIAAVARALRPGGSFHLATDWTPYANWMLAMLDDATELFENSAGPGRFSVRPAQRPITKFERRGQRLGHRVHDLIYRRR